MTDVRHIGPRSLGATLGGLGATAMLSLFGLKPEDWETSKKVFTSHRRRDGGEWGWEVWLWLGAHGMNLTIYGVAPFPRHRWEAENWMCDFAEAHGFKAMKRVRPKKKPAPKLTLIIGEKP